MESFIILIKLLCAHLFSDFILQTDSLNNGKHVQGAKGIYFQLLHSGIHAAAAYLFVADWSCWIIPLVIFVSHFTIDFLKCKISKDSLCSFIIDQICHIAVIVILWYALFHTDIELPSVENFCSLKVWGIVLAYILMLKPSSVLLSLFLGRWAPSSQNTQSLPNAGKWIGYIERVLILTFVLIGNVESVGFLLAAKSVFRFGELNKAKEIRTTEYVLIGTLASFTIAILTGLAVSLFM